ncbi:ribonucleotide reductase [Earliella scabrosa]|nr:ribonucleotide reductase [Earliella scabrosa]
MSSPSPDVIDYRSRYVLLPIRRPKLWAAYEAAQSSIWTASDIDLTVDRDQWSSKLLEDERSFISTILAYFTAADGIIVENLAQRFCSEVTLPEARCFYGVQLMMENVHSEVYSRIVMELLPDSQEQEAIFSSVEKNPAILSKAEWSRKWIEDKTASLTTRLVAFAIIEGIFFSSSFAAIYWLKSRGLMPGLVQTNVMIARDEGSHVSFACLMYHELGGGVSSWMISNMVQDAVKIEKTFFTAALPGPLTGMNSALMGDYIEHIADVLLDRFGCPTFYNKKNPFAFMEAIGVGVKANFFERPVGDYRYGFAASDVLVETYYITCDYRLEQIVLRSFSSLLLA